MSTKAFRFSHSRWAAAGDLFAFGCLVLVVLLTGGILATALQLGGDLESSLWSTLPGAGLLIAGCTLLIRRHGLRWRNLGLRFTGSRRALAFQTLALLAALYAALIALAAITGEPAGGQPDLGMFRDLEGNWRLFLLALLVVWTAAAFGEEMIFRGFLLDRIARLLSGGAAAWRAAAILQGVIFGLSHLYQGPAGMWLTGVMGVIFGLAYLMNGRTLLPLIFAHGLIDTLSLTRMFLGG